MLPLNATRAKMARRGFLKDLGEVLDALTEPPIVTVSDAAAYTVLAKDSGKIHVLPDFTSSCTLTLPTAEAGLTYRFIGKGVATEAQNWVFAAPSAAAYFLGGVQFLDSDEPGSGATLVPVYPDGNSNDNLTVTTPQAGTWIEMVCDGTNWIVSGIVFSATAPAFAD